jgi:hypothetical protein
VLIPLFFESSSIKICFKEGSLSSVVFGRLSGLFGQSGQGFEELQIIEDRVDEKAWPNLQDE